MEGIEAKEDFTTTLGTAFTSDNETDFTTFNGGQKITLKLRISKEEKITRFSLLNGEEVIEYCESLLYKEAGEMIFYIIKNIVIKDFFLYRELFYLKMNYFNKLTIKFLYKIYIISLSDTFKIIELQKKIDIQTNLLKEQNKLDILESENLARIMGEMMKLQDPAGRKQEQEEQEHRAREGHNSAVAAMVSTRAEKYTVMTAETINELDVAIEEIESLQSFEEVQKIAEQSFELLEETKFEKVIGEKEDPFFKRHPVLDPQSLPVSEGIVNRIDLLYHVIKSEKNKALSASSQHAFWTSICRQCSVDALHVSVQLPGDAMMMGQKLEKVEEMKKLKGKEVMRKLAKVRELEAKVMASVSTRRKKSKEKVNASKVVSVAEAVAVAKVGASEE